MIRFFSRLSLTLFIALISHNGNAQSFDDPDFLFKYLADLEKTSKGSVSGSFFFPLLRSGPCSRHLKSLRKNYLPKTGSDQLHAISCDTLQSVWNKYSGENYYWSACTVNKDTLGTSDHISACVSRLGQDWSRFRKIDSCALLYDAYDFGLTHAIDPLAFFNYRPTAFPPNTDTLVGEHEGVRITATYTKRLVTSKPIPFRQGENSRIIFKFDYGGRDCAKAAQAIAQMSGGSTKWVSCLNYTPEDPATHIQACLQGELARLKDCPAIRTAYETRLSEAHGGMLPTSYKTLSCDQLQPILQAKADAAAARAAEREKRTAQRATRQKKQKAEDTGIGFIFLALLIAIAGIGLIWVISAIYKKRPDITRTPDNRTYSKDAPSDQESRGIIEAINAQYDAGTGRVSATMWAHVVDKVEVPEAEGGTSWKDIDFHIEAILTRNLGAMTSAEREMLRVVALLDALNNESICSRLEYPRLGLVYGDGKAAIEHINYGSVSMKYVAAKGLTSPADFVRLGMGMIGVHEQVGKDFLVQILEELNAMDWGDHPLVKEATRRLRGGSAWAGGDDLTGDFDPKAKDGLFFGLHDETGDVVRYSGEGSIISIAAPGSGKTQTNVLPNLLEWDGPAIVLDVKGEIYKDTAAWRAQNGHPVYRFAPLDPDNSHCFNPLDLVRSDPDHLWEDSRFLASMLIVPQSKQDPYWEQRAQDFITAAVAAVCRSPEGTEGRNLSRVIDYCHGDDFDDMLARLQTSKIRTMERAATSWEETEKKNEKQFTSFLSSAQTAMTAWEGAKIERVIHRSDWHPFDLRKAPYPTIYISLKPGEIDVYSSLLRVFVAQHIRTLVSELPGRDVKPILFMLDELPRLKHMPPVEEALEIGRQYGIKLWMFAQSLGQLENAYPNAKGMIGSCAVRIFMNPSMHDGTAERISKELGTFESPLDGSDQMIAQPQELAGDRYKDLMLVLPAGRRPIRVRKQFAYNTAPYKERMKSGKSS